MIITVQHKDDLLLFLTQSDGVRISINLARLSEEINVDQHTVDQLLRYFERLQLLNAKRCSGGDVHISLNIEAYDTMVRGGFIAQEELLKKNIEKLLLELENLKKDVPEKVELISSIIGNISTAISLFL